MPRCGVRVVACSCVWAGAGDLSARVGESVLRDVGVEVSHRCCLCLCVWSPGWPSGRERARDPLGLAGGWAGDSFIDPDPYQLS